MSMKLLVIDDDPVATAVYRKRFEAEGFDVEVAADGAEGLIAAQSCSPDVVLLDLDMPRVNGIDWLVAVRDDRRFENLPIVVLTAGAISWQERAARYADVVRVLPKAKTTPAILVNAVRAAALASAASKLEQP
jgi:two-component system chemotaxis response regulator CheY